jgi:hypothetical protein
VAHHRGHHRAELSVAVLSRRSVIASSLAGVSALIFAPVCTAAGFEGPS